MQIRRRCHLAQHESGRRVRTTADSEISTTLPTVNRRMLMFGTTAMLVRLLPTGSSAAADVAENSSTDPTLRLWQEWRAAHHRTKAFCRQQQMLETQLIRTVGFPYAKVALSGVDETVRVFSAEAIYDIFGTDPEVETPREKALADFDASQARWDSEADRIGYRAAKEEEVRSADREQNLLDAFVDTPARSLTGVMAKLDAILSEGESLDDRERFPWPHIRSALADLQRLGSALA